MKHPGVLLEASPNQMARNPGTGLLLGTQSLRTLTDGDYAESSALNEQVGQVPASRWLVRADTHTVR
jgi:hypothetical protein